MKKFLVLIGLFLLAMIAGFLYAEWKGIFIKPQAASFNEQVNYLFIRVDDLRKSKPALQTVWGVFMYNNGNSTALYFNPLYPGGSSAELKSAFSLNEKRLPDQAFMQALKKFDFTIHGMILTDQVSQQFFTQWISPVVVLSPEGSTNPQELLSQQKQALKSVCQALNQRSFSALARPDWKSMPAGRFTASPAPEQVQALIEHLFYKAKSVDCQVME